MWNMISPIPYLHKNPKRKGNMMVKSEEKNRCFSCGKYENEKDILGHEIRFEKGHIVPLNYHHKDSDVMRTQCKWCNTYYKDYISWEDKPRFNLYAILRDSSRSELEDAFKRLNIVIKKMTFKFIDLFAGIGGFHTALKNNGGKCVYASDIDKNCQKVYETNYGIKVNGDITKLDIDAIPYGDVLAAGFPCQPFSSAGLKKADKDDRFKVYKYILKIIKKVKPKIVILENVKNLITIENGKIIKKIQEDLEDCGYHVNYDVLNSMNFGVPQNRQRVFIVASLSKKFEYERLKEVKNCTNVLSIMDGDEDILFGDDYVITDKKHWTVQKSGLIFCGYIKGTLRKKGVLPDTEHLSRVHKQPNRIYNAKGTYPTLSSSETSGRYYVYNEEEETVYKLSVNDLYILMGFPDSFVKHEKENVARRQIGNAVTVNVIDYLIKEIKKQELL